MSIIYEVKKGDDLYSIAKYNGVTLGELLTANPKFSTRDPDLIFVGEKINIPTASAFCNSIDIKKGLAKCPKRKTAILSEVEAQNIFDILAIESHIPFDYPPDCCYSRAHEMCRIMEENGVECKKYWLFDQHWGSSKQKASLAPKDSHGKAILFPNLVGSKVAWVYHVAPIVKVRKADGTVEDRIIDPSISSKPIRKDEWEGIMGSPAGSYAEESGSDAYFQNKKKKIYLADPMGKETNKMFKEHKNNRNKILKAAGMSAP